MQRKILSMLFMFCIISLSCTEDLPNWQEAPHAIEFTTDIVNADKEVRIVGNDTTISYTLHSDTLIFNLDLKNRRMEPIDGLFQMEGKVYMMLKEHSGFSTHLEGELAPLGTGDYMDLFSQEEFHMVTTWNQVFHDSTTLKERLDDIFMTNKVSFYLDIRFLFYYKGVKSNRINCYMYTDESQRPNN